MISPAFAAMVEQQNFPIFEDDTLYLEGPIDDQMYDQLAYNQKKLQKIKVVSLNSYGGSTQWGLLIAEKLKSLNVDTVIEEGSVCASACVYLFAAGQERIAHNETWIGVHGARLGNGFKTDFITNCFVFDGQYLVLTEELENCPATQEKWKKIAKKSTDTGFKFLEDQGVSETFKTDYNNLPDDPNWFKDGNILRTKDWKLTPKEAQSYNLVTKII